MPELVVSHLSCRRHGQQILQLTNFVVRGGELVILLGPNGVGKSTFRGILGLVKAQTGTVMLDGSDVLRMPSVERSRSIAYLPQAKQLAWPLRVRDVVSLGRYPHTGARGALAQADWSIVGEALEDCNLEDLADRRVDRQSGCELASVHFARALSTQAKIIDADEPTDLLIHGGLCVHEYYQELRD